MALLREIRLEVVDVIVADIEPALTCVIESWKDDRREQLCWKFEEYRDRGESGSFFAGND